MLATTCKFSLDRSISPLYTSPALRFASRSCQMRTLFVTVCVFVPAFAAFAQSDRGTITGTVTDPVGAVVAGVAIEAKNASTGFVYPVATSGTGNYTISQLPVGTYEITAAASGFKKAVRPGIEVQASSTFRVDFTLEVGATNESVTVTA